MKSLLINIKNIIWVLLCLVLAVNVYLLFSKLVMKEELPSVFGYSQVVVLSGSMEPVFSPGDVLVVKKEPVYQVGDVVTFSENGAMITHRIVGEENGTFQTKGDANNTVDGIALAQSRIHGKLAFVIPEIGNILLFLKTPLGILCIVMAGFLLIEIPYLWDKKKKVADAE